MSAIRIDSLQDALIIVDVQNDFCPGGTLAVPRGHEVVPLINALLQHHWLSVATMDWHPEEHCSFKPRGGPWPPHCVQESAGAALHPDLNARQIKVVITKGSHPDEEAYSGFHGTQLAKILHGKGVKRVVVCGLATDYCVRATALDALQEGFEVVVLEDAVRGVDVHPGDSQRALEELRRAGALVAVSTDLKFN